MAIWDLAEIRTKVRQVSGRYSPQELSNDELDERINKYIQYQMPADLKLERYHTYYEFLTVANQQTYTLPSGYVNFEPPATIDNLELIWYQDPSIYYENNPQNVGRQTIGTGDGTTTSFTGTASNFPILPGSAVVTDNTEVFQDTNTDYDASPVTITGSLGGTASLNYATGALTVTFNSAPSNGQSIVFSYIQFQAGRPTAVLLYNNLLTFFTVPDTAYRFKVKAYANSLVTTSAGVTQTNFTSATDRPLLDEWGPCIAYGTARSIHADFGEMEAYAQVTALYKEQMAYVARRTHQNLLNVRSQPSF